jgi:hypothetical protein
VLQKKLQMLDVVSELQRRDQGGRG